MPLKVNKGKQPKPRRIMLYGPPGIGKSTFAAQAPGVLFIPIEEGINDLDTDSLDQPKTFEEFKAQIKALIEEPHDYQWLAIDTINHLERLIHEDICIRDSADSIDQALKGYGRGYKLAYREMSNVLLYLDLLRNERGIGIILLAHNQQETVHDPITGDYDMHCPALREDVSIMVEAWCDEVLFATRQVFTKEVDHGFNRKSQKAVGAGDRILMAGSANPAAKSKSRLGLPAELPLDWQAFSQYLNATGVQ